MIRPMSHETRAFLNSFLSCPSPLPDIYYMSTGSLLTPAVDAPHLSISINIIEE
jgi:hypothetical protein